MNFAIKGSKENIMSLMRGTGYHFQREDKESSEFVFVKPLARGGFPRFHLYLKKKDNNLIFNLHLDQKRPIYKGAAAHSGEYSGDIIKEEIKKLKEKILK